jgi:hypothetical protein
MQTMEQSLAELVLKRVITAQMGFARSSRPDQLRGLLERAGFTQFDAPTPRSDGLRLAEG